MRFVITGIFLIIWLASGRANPIHEPPRAGATNCISATATVLAPAKCGRAVGRAEIKVTGGSGNYTYSLGAPLLNGLAAGPYQCIVTDNANAACRDTVDFVIPNVNPVAKVNVTPYDIICPDGATGFVSFDVESISNFALPYSFSLRDAAGNGYLPDELVPERRYSLQITDADGCVLPPDTFRIRRPPAFDIQVATLPETCERGGQLSLDIRGGNGGYTVDWADAPGFINPEDRENLSPGLYQAIVFDRLFCRDTIGPFRVPTRCTRRDTGYVAASVNRAVSYCFEAIPGVRLTDINFSLLGRSTSGRSAFGIWTLSPQGCLRYEAGNRSRLGADTICMTRSVPAIDLADTLCLIVHIARVPPTDEDVFFTVQASRSSTACGTIPVGYGAPLIQQRDRTGLRGRTPFGTYQLSPTNACITFNAYVQAGFNLDTVHVLVCDPTQLRCHTIRYVLSVLPFADCSAGFVPFDTASLRTANCTVNTPLCVPIPFSEILNYVIFDNGAPYFAGFAGCDPDSVAAYSIPGLPDGGPYQLTRWRVDGQDLSGNFTDPPDLLRLMKRLDPGQNWEIDLAGTITGGKPWRRYGDLRVVSARGETVTLRPTFRLVPKGTELRFPPGQHVMTLRRIQTGCADTLRVTTTCVDCPPIHNYTTGEFDLISFKTKNCRADTVLCTNILRSEWNDYTVTDNGQAVSQFVFCNNNAGLRLDTGYHEIRIVNRRSTCPYTVKAQVICPGQIFPDSVTIARPDTFMVNPNQRTELPVIANDIIQGGFANQLAIDNMTIVDNPALGQVSVSFLQSNVLYTPNTDRCGTDRFVYRIRALDKRADTALVVIKIRCPDLLIFDGFSPNGDGVNDRWQVRGLEPYENNRIEIFNRWGSLVYRCDRCAEGDAWDGTNNGQPLPDATYFYVVDLGNGEKRSGYVHLLR